MFEDMEFSQMGAACGVVFGIVVLVIMGQEKTLGLIWKILGFGLGAVIGYIIGQKNFG